MENITVHVANDKVDKDRLHELICALILEDFDNEELKLKYLQAIVS